MKGEAVSTGTANDMRPPQVDQLACINRFADSAYRADQLHVGELYLTNREVDRCAEAIEPEIFQELAALIPGKEICVRNTEPRPVQVQFAEPARGTVYAAEVQAMTPEEMRSVAGVEVSRSTGSRVLVVRYYFPWNSVNAGPIRLMLAGDPDARLCLRESIQEIVNSAWRRVAFQWHLPGVSALSFDSGWLSLV